jgi:hypothetical protein
MRKLIAGLGVGALLLASGCYVTPYRARVTVRSYGYGGSGVDTVAAADLCRRQAYREGWRFVREDSVTVTGPFTARLRFVADGTPFRSHVTCFYDARTNFVDIR